MVLSGIFHGINATLVYTLASKLSRRKTTSFMAALFFLTNSTSANTVLWPAAVIVTLFSTTVILVSLLFYFSYIKTGRNRELVFAFLILYLSLFLKETGVFLFILYPLGAIFSRGIKIPKVYPYVLVALLFFAGMITFRLSGYKASNFPVALYLTGSSNSYIATLFTRLMLYPLTSFSLIFFPVDNMVSLARSLTNLYYPFVSAEDFVQTSQTIVLDLIASILSISFLAFIFFGLKDARKEVKKNTAFTISFTLMSLMPYAIIEKHFAYLDSRFYYVTAIGSSILLALLLARLKKIYIFAATFVFLMLILSHTKAVQSQIKEQVAISKERQSILEQIKNTHGSLAGSKNIFLVTGSSDYYLPGNPIPFQNGFGYTLMVTYFDSGKIPSELLDQDFLFEIGSYGYKEINEKGFGYFNNAELIPPDIKSNPEINMINLHYAANNNEIQIR
jgi:hypothetical protein